MNFSYTQTEIRGLTVIEPFCAADERGYYKKYCEKGIFRLNGIEAEFTECSDIFSRRGALRGLHYQECFSQGKLVHVLKGAIFDVALDLRPGSATYGKWKSFELNDKNMLSVFIPEGFAHGFVALEDDTVFSYMCTGKYDPPSCGGILWKDPELGIPWPIDESKLIMTEKDKKWPTLREYTARKGLKIK